MSFLSFRTEGQPSVIQIFEHPTHQQCSVIVLLAQKGLRKNREFTSHAYDVTNEPVKHAFGSPLDSGHSCDMFKIDLQAAVGLQSYFQAHLARSPVHSKKLKMMLKRSCSFNSYSVP